MADENRMITFEYARNNWDEFKKQVIPTSLECMTKMDIGNYLNADMDILDNYLPNQLIPRSKFFGIPIGVPNDIVVGDTMGYSGANLNSFSDAKWNATSESLALVTAFGYNKIIGFKIYLNKTESERQAIASNSSNYFSGTNKYYPIFLDDSNKHLIKKIRIINPDLADTEYTSDNQGVYYNNNIGTLRKITFVVSGNNFVGATGNRITDITVPPVSNTDITIENLYIGFTRLDATALRANAQGQILLQLLDSNNTPLMMKSVWASEPIDIIRIMAFDVEFRQSV